MKAVTKIYFLNEEGEKFFGEGPCMLLREIEKTGSLNQAAQSLGMAYTKALKLMKQAEKELGFALTVRSTGGKFGGGSVLTPEGKQWLERYEAYRNACREANRRLYEESFPEYVPRASGSSASSDTEHRSSSGDTEVYMEETDCRFPGTGLVIMASGMGKRFGSNKLLADFDGKTMIQRILDTSKNLFEKRVVVTRHREVEELCRQQRIPVILHGFPGRNDTIRLGVEYMQDMKTCIFTASDQPLLSERTLRHLAEEAEKDREDMIRAEWEGQGGIPCAFPSWTFSELMSLPGKAGGSYLQRKYPEKVKAIAAGNEWELKDADTKENLEELLSIWKTLYSAKAEDVRQNWEQEP